MHWCIPSKFAASQKLNQRQAVQIWLLGGPQVPLGYGDVLQTAGGLTALTIILMMLTLIILRVTHSNAGLESCRAPLAQVVMLALLA